MANQTIEVKRNITEGKNKKERAINVNFDMPETLQDAITRFGEDNVFNLTRRGIVGDVKAEVSRLLQGGRNGAHRKSDEEIHSHVASYKPGAEYQTAIKTAKVEAVINSLSDEQLEALLAKRKAAASNGGTTEGATEGASVAAPTTVGDTTPAKGATGTPKRK